MNWFVTIYSGLLFFLFTPDILCTIAIDDNTYTTTAIHALLFAVVLKFTYNLVWGFSMFMGFRPLPYDFKNPEIGDKLDNLFKRYFAIKNNPVYNKNGLSQKNSDKSVV